MSGHDHIGSDGERSGTRVITSPNDIECDYIFKKDLENLNQEILDNSNKIYQIIQIVFTAVPVFLAGVLTLGRGGDSPSEGEGSWWFISITSLLVFAIIIPSVLLVTSSLNSTVRISQYLRLRYFSSDKLRGWQHYIQYFRAQDNANKYRSFGKSLTWIFAGLSLLTILISLASFLVYVSRNDVVGGMSNLALFRILIYIVGLGSSLAMSFLSIRELRVAWSTGAFARCYDLWVTIDERIRQEIPPDSPSGSRVVRNEQSPAPPRK